MTRHSTARLTLIFCLACTSRCLGDTASSLMVALLTPQPHTFLGAMTCIIHQPSAITHSLQDLNPFSTETHCYLEICVQLDHFINIRKGLCRNVQIWNNFASHTLTPPSHHVSWLLCSGEGRGGSTAHKAQLWGLAVTSLVFSYAAASPARHLLG
ncbi:hypothetical protein E2C01_004270 [Portunus trituberculatus]|uniref:Secreted protein n=1 Tax=Portunus trituberculatus TaxID=210409 RepID=A0A5B7CRZ1_PORTR|nr:hypothetical protein [Portunus trituberculatus]